VTQSRDSELHPLPMESQLDCLIGMRFELVRKSVAPHYNLPGIPCTSHAKSADALEPKGWLPDCIWRRREVRVLKIASLWHSPRHFSPCASASRAACTCLCWIQHAFAGVARRTSDNRTPPASLKRAHCRLCRLSITMSVGVALKGATGLCAGRAASRGSARAQRPTTHFPADHSPESLRPAS